MAVAVVAMVEELEELAAARAAVTAAEMAVTVVAGVTVVAVMEELKELAEMAVVTVVTVVKGGVLAHREARASRKTSGRWWSSRLHFEIAVDSRSHSQRCSRAADRRVAGRCLERRTPQWR